MDKIPRHFKLYKPCGIISQLNSNCSRELRKKKFLNELFDFPEGVMPIGRLDEKSEGLLLLTTDGKLSDDINRSGVEKEYYAQLDGEITNEAEALLEKGVAIGFEGKRYLYKAVKDMQIKCSCQYFLRPIKNFELDDTDLPVGLVLHLQKVSSDRFVK